MDFINILQQFHLIRPYWLLALIPLALVIWAARKTQSRSRSWASVIDPRLLPHLLQKTPIIRKPAPALGLFFLGSLIIFALAGPAFEKRAQPVFKAQSALVILLDLSRSMDAGDVKPNRLQRAHFKIEDILKQRKEGQTALIAYAADAYVVSPLTDDAATIAAQVPALQTYIMPAQGSRLDRALSKAQELFNNAGTSSGHIFIVSDSINPSSLSTLKTLSSDGFSSSILAIGTADGAPIAEHNGGFVKDRNGQIVVPKLDISMMRKAAQAGGGTFSLLSANDSDINRLLSEISLDTNTLDTQKNEEGNQYKTDIWHEEGPWLLLFILPFAAYAFRKGLVFLLLVMIIPLPQPAQAFEWQDLWKNNNQKGAQALEQGDAEQAAELFNDAQWKSSAHYEAGQYNEAANLLNDINTADAHYNRGNALAKSGQLDAAIKAYNQALDLDNNHEDAKHNKEIVQQAQQQKQQESDQQNSDKSQDQGSQNQQKQDSSSQQQSNEQEDSSQQNAQQNESSDGAQENQQDNLAQDDAEEPNNEESQNQDQPDKNKTAEQAAQEKEQEKNTDPSSDKAQQLSQADTEASLDLEQQQTQQWLKRIPDDPGGLLRRKFKYQYGRENKQSEQNPW